MTKAIDTSTSDCRLVRYGVYHPTNGWLKKDGRTYLGDGTCSTEPGQVPCLISNYNTAKSTALKHNAQLVTFDVTPCLRSWPGEEPKDTK